MKTITSIVVSVLISFCYIACSSDNKLSKYVTNANAPAPNSIGLVDVSPNDLIRIVILPDCGGIVRGMSFGDPLKKVIDTVAYYSSDGKANFRPQYERTRTQSGGFSKDSIKVVSIGQAFYEGPNTSKGGGVIFYELINDKLYSMHVYMGSAMDGQATNKNLDKAFATFSSYFTNRYGKPGHESDGDDMSKPDKIWSTDAVYVHLKYSSGNGLEIIFYKSEEDRNFREKMGYGPPPRWVLLPNQSISDFK